MKKIMKKSLDEIKEILKKHEKELKENMELKRSVFLVLI